MIELVESDDPASPINKFIEERGEGLHHVSIRVEDIRATMAEWGEKGVRFNIDPPPSSGRKTPSLPSPTPPPPAASSSSCSSTRKRARKSPARCSGGEAGEGIPRGGCLECFGDLAYTEGPRLRCVLIQDA